MFVLLCGNFRALFLRVTRVETNMKIKKNWNLQDHNILSSIIWVWNVVCHI